MQQQQQRGGVVGGVGLGGVGKERSNILSGMVL
jgi:hypothetical protein